MNNENSVNTEMKNPSASENGVNAEMKNPSVSDHDINVTDSPIDGSCPHCGGEFQISVNGGNIKEYKCKNCGYVFYVENNHSLEKLYALNAFKNDVINLLYKKTKGGKKAVIESWKDSERKFEKYLEKCGGDSNEDPLFAIARAAYLTDGFEHNGEDKAKVEELYLTAKEYLNENKKAKCVKEIVRLYQKKLLNKTRNLIVGISIAFVSVLVAAFIAVFSFAPTVEDKDSGVLVRIPNTAISVLDKFSTEVDVEKYPSNSVAYIDAKNALRNETEKFELFDISLINGGSKVEITGEVTVEIPIPDGLMSSALKVYYIANDESYEEIPSSVSAANNTITFKTSHFSLYAIAERHPIVTFDAGSGSETDRQMVVRDTLVKEPAAPTKDGYTFGGWEYDGKLWDFATQTVKKDIVITARWIPNEYIVTLVPNGAELNSETVKVRYMEAYSSLPQNLRKDGYTFAGWYTAEKNGTKVGPEDFVKTAKDHTLYALWTANTNQIIFNANGGSGKMDSAKAATGSTIVLPANQFAREGYIFVGWSTLPTGQVEFEDSAQYQMGKNASCTLYAIWEKLHCALRFDGNGGEGSMQMLDLVYGDTIYLPENSFTRTGYNFVGWSTTLSGKVEYENKAKYTVSENGEIVLYARWRKAENKLAFNANGGQTNGGMETLVYETDTVIFLPKNKFTYEGYTFLGWSTSAGGTVVYEDSARYQVGEEDCTLYAVWIGNENNLAFHANGGTGDMDSVIIRTGESKNLPLNVFFREGYTFVGWSTAPGGAKVYDDGAIYNMKTTGEVLYAVWIANSNTIIFDANGGNGIMQPLTVQTDAAIKLPMCPFTRKGYTFAGWSTVKNATSFEYENGADYTVSSASQVVLYAVWTKNTYTLHYESNGGTACEDRSFNIDTMNFTLATCEREGYTFDGWYLTENLTGERINQIDIGDEKDIIVYAKWIPKNFNVAFDANGGTVLVSGMDVTYDSDWTLPVPERKGYTFLGWYSGNYEVTDGKYTYNGDLSLVAQWEICRYNITYELNGGSNSDANPTAYTILDTFILIAPTKRESTFLGWTYEGQTEPTLNVTVEQGRIGDITFTAHWETNKYTAVFDANGGTVDPTMMQIEYGTEFVLPLPVNPGYTFEGWFDGDRQYVSGVWEFSYDVTLKARWTASTYKVTYDAGGGYVSEASKTFIFGHAFEFLIPERIGYSFDGWYLGDEKVELSGAWLYTNDITLTAKWQANSYTVTYDANGGTPSVESENAVFDSDYTLATATRPGYFFDGWYYGDVLYTSGIWKTAENITLKAKWVADNSTKYTVNHYHQNLDDDEYTLESTEIFQGKSDTEVTPAVKTYVGFISPATKTETIKGDGTLVIDYYYDRVAFTLTYVTNGGDAIDAQVFRYGHTLSVSDPTRAGYTFGGWFTDAGLTEAYSATATLEADTTIYAYWTEENKVSDFTYTGTDEITITGYNGTDTELHIPSYIGGVPVTVIEDYAFENKAELVKVIVPETVRVIGIGAFKGCNAITDITLPFVGNSATATHYNAVFGYIFGYVHLQGGYYHSWKSDAGFKNVQYGEQPENTTLQYSCANYWQNNDCYYGSFYYCIPATIKNVTITVQNSIPTAAFNNCSFIESITLPATVTTIGDYAFQNCTVLKRLNSEVDGEFNIPAGVTEIKSYTFKNCTSITKVTVPADLTAIGNYAFSGCTAIAKFNSENDGELTVPSKVVTIGERALEQIGLIKKLVVPESVTSIGYAAFNRCNAIEDVTLPFVGKSVDATYYEAVFGYIFGYYHERGSRYHDYNYTNEYNNGTYGTQPENTTLQYSCAVYYYDGDYYYGSFYYCIPATIKNVTITVQTAIPTAAFNNCSFIETIKISDTVTSIGDYAFQNCTVLKRLNSEVDGEFNIPAGVTEIKSYTFKNCTSITKVTVPADLTAIGNYAFSGCTAIVNFNSENDGELTVPAKVVTIGKRAFEEISLIKKIVVPESVTSIGYAAFDGCNAITDITLPFVGNSATATYYDAVFGYIFGYYYVQGSYYHSYNNSLEYKNVLYGEQPENTVWQYSCANYYHSGDYYYESFYYCIPATLKNVTITVQTVIPTAAFSNCSFIENITLPATVTTIGDYAFQNCTGLKRLNSEADGEFNIPEGVTEIKAYAFKNCTLATKLTLPEGLTVIGERSFTGCTALVRINSENDGEMIIPGSVTSIARYSFENLGLIKKITVPDSVTEIGFGAFYGCNAIEEITIPFVGWKEDASEERWRTLGYIFGDITPDDDKMNSLADRYLTSSEEGYTSQSPNESKYFYFVIPKTLKAVTITKQTNIPAYAFRNCDLIESITLPDTVTSIGDYAFENCTGLKRLNSDTDGVFNMPMELVSIGSYAFNCCTGIVNIGFGDESKLETIGSYAFANCTAITELKLPAALTEIGKRAFSGCVNVLKVNSENDGELTVPASLTTIGEYAFENFGLITKITVPENVTYIGYGAFRACNALEEITVPFVGVSENTEDYFRRSFGYIFGDATPENGYLDTTNNQYLTSGEDGLTSQITKGSNEYYCFAIPKSLKVVTITKQVDIPAYAFRNCDLIESITLPANVNSIGSSAFENCTSLKRINGAEDGEFNLPSTLTSIGNYTFKGCTSIGRINSETDGEMILPEALTSIGYLAFDGMVLITKVTVPDSVTAIGEKAFSGLTALESITVPFVGYDVNSTYTFPYIFGTVPETLKNVVITVDTTIPNNAFNGLANIESITIPITVESIGEKAFYKCTALKRLNSDTDGEFNVPAGMTVINYLTFYDCDSMTKVTIPANITIIGTEAFNNCSALTTVEFAEESQLQVIRNYAFCECSAIAEIKLPNGVTSIGERAFRNLALITEIVVPDSVTEIGQKVFEGCMALESMTLPFVGNKIDSNTAFGHFFAAIPESIKNITITLDTTIPEYAFSGMAFVENIKIPADVTEIGAHAFRKCTALKRLNSDTDGVFNIPVGVTKINYLTFYDCDSMTKVTIPAGVTVIDAEAFNNCSALATVEFAEGSTLETIGNYAFTTCAALPSIQLPATVKTIGNYAFNDCASLLKVNSENDGEITLPASVETIGERAFRNAVLITKVVIPNNVTGIGWEAFAGFTALESITLPFVGYNAESTATFTGVTGSISETLKNIVITLDTTIPNSAFKDLTVVESITIPATVTTIGERAFQNCISLKRLNSDTDGVFNIPDGVADVPYYAFYGCESATSVVFGEASVLETIGVGAFEASLAIVEMKLPSTLRSIGSCAFKNCVALSKVNSENEGELIIPLGVTSIGEYTFEKMELITKAVIPESVVSIGYRAFNLCSAIESITVPFIGYNVDSDQDFGVIFNGIPSTLKNIVITVDTTIPNKAFNGLANIETVKIPATVTSIGEYAFNKCQALKSLNSDKDGVFNIPVGVTEIKQYTFCLCRMMTDLVFDPESQLTKVEKYAFSNCDLLTELKLPLTLTTIGDAGFAGCINVTKVNSEKTGELLIPASVTSIGAWAFSGMADITKVLIPDSVTYMGTGLFEGFITLEDITIPFINNEMTDGDRFSILFKNANDNVNVPATIKKVTVTRQTVIPDHAFRNCKYIEQIKIPDSVTSIGIYAFDGCSALLRLNGDKDGVFNIPEEITQISAYSFRNCTLAETVNFGEAVTEIGEYAFANCISITRFNSENDGELVIPDGVAVIYGAAFEGLTSVTKIIVSESVCEIGQGAFYKCSGLTDITLPFVGKKVGETNEKYAVFGFIFGYNTGSIYNHPNENYDIPKSIKKITVTAQNVIPEYAFRNCDFIEVILLPLGAAPVGEHSFDGCSASVLYAYDDKTSIWNGTDISTEFSGSGTESDPYKINSAADLAYLASSINAGESYEGKYFVLGVNVNLNARSWTPIGTKATPFAGTFDGNGKKIYNLSVTADTAYAGLFGNVSGSVKGVGIISGTVKPASTAATTYAAPLVAYLTGTVENCYSRANVNIKIANILYAGGLVGYVDETATVKDSYAYGYVLATSTGGFSYAGGFAAANKGTIEGSIAFGNVTAKGSNDTYSRNGGFVATNSGTVTECYRSNAQVLTKYTVVGDAYCEDGIVGAFDDIVTYAKTEWDPSIWAFDMRYPTHK